MKSRIFRALICLLVICCLVVNMVPVQSEAFAAEYAFYYAARVVVASILIGLGINFAEDFTDFAYESIDGAVQAVNDFCADIAPVFVHEDKMQLIKAGDAYLVSDEVIEAVRGWLYDNEYIVDDSAPEGSVYFGGDLYPEFPASCYGDKTPYMFIYSDTDGSVWLAYTKNPLYVAYSSTWGYYYNSSGGNTCCKYPLTDSGWGDYTTCSFGFISEYHGSHLIASGFAINGKDDFAATPASDLTSTQTTYIEGVVPGYIASQDEALGDGYSEWSAGAITVPADIAGTDEDILAYPVGIGNDVDETLGFAQSNVWAGTSTYVDSTLDQETGTDTETGTVSGTLADTALGEFLTALVSAITAPFEWIWEKIESLFSPWFTSISGWFQELISGVASIPGQFAGWFQDLISGVAAIPGQFLGWFEALIQGVTNIFDLINEVWQLLTEALLAGIQALFMPAEGYVDAKLEALTAEYAFADSIAQTGVGLKGFLMGLGSQPPIIYIDLGATTGSHNIGGKTVFIDLTWYAQYKGTMDLIISAFLWLWFAWRMLLSLPGIIQGTSGMWGPRGVTEEVKSLVVVNDRHRPG